ncbi:hypothetical protein [Burkholderia metallica]|jgi:DNA-directed RNA polymerase subunit N (RpoN/RPB10)|uniref:hypothetical protein n=1 Tax=Burkholderia metallica TaxID=488729 RepID=UPI0015766E1B|nr:hypothetical protein [Burkholderia metallica]
MDIYDLYKPFRNQLRKLALRPSLHRIWAYQRGVDASGVLRIRLHGGQWAQIYVWELLLLCREIVLHAAGNDDALASTNGLIILVNHIRRIDEQISASTVNSAATAMQALHPIIQKQARWQYVRYEAIMFRAFHIYNAPELAPIVDQTMGLSVRAMYTLAMAIGGATRNVSYTNAVQDYEAFKVSHGMRDAFFQHIGTTTKQLRDEVQEASPRCDERWAFTWNALEKYPLINPDGNGSPRFFCPFPDLLLRRVSEGLFYDLLNSTPSFGDKYGRAFERYVGLVLDEVFRGGQFVVRGEDPYKVKGSVRHGVDWIVEDATANIFIECKARRLRQQAKEIADGEALQRALDDLARAIVQLYRNIDDALHGYANWRRNGLPIFPFVVTYEDWYLFAPHVVDHLLESVRYQLSEAGLAQSLVETMPFFVTSISEFEKAGQAIAHLGIQRFCAARAISEYRHFDLGSFASTAFQNEDISYRPLLQESWRAIFSDLPHILEPLSHI